MDSVARMARVAVAKAVLLAASGWYATSSPMPFEESPPQLVDAASTTRGPKRTHNNATTLLMCVEQSCRP